MSVRSVLASGAGDSARRASMVRTDWGYEIKFLVSDAKADQAIAWAREYLSPDPHVDPALGDGYKISSLYLDTPDRTVFHQIGPDRHRKYRVRRYGSETLLYLERKLKGSGRIRKFRSWIPDDELSLLEDGLPDREWSGDWFRRRLRIRGLEPVCRVTYLRIARVGEIAGQPVRLTVDRQVRAARAVGFEVRDVTDGVPLLSGEAILELKFPRVLPHAFKELARDLAIAPGSVSKYRRAVAACELFDAAAPSPLRANGAGPVPRARKSDSHSVAVA